MPIKRKKFTPKNPSKTAKKAKIVKEFNQSSILSQNAVQSVTCPKIYDNVSDIINSLDAKKAEVLPCLTASDQNNHNKNKVDPKCNPLRFNEIINDAGQKTITKKSLDLENNGLDKTPCQKVSSKSPVKNSSKDLAEIADDNETILSTIKSYNPSLIVSKQITHGQKVISSSVKSKNRIVDHVLNNTNDKISTTLTKLECNQSQLPSIFSKTEPVIHGHDATFRSIKDQNSRSLKFSKEKLVEPIYSSHKEPAKIVSGIRKKFKPKNKVIKNPKKIKSNEVKIKNSSTILTTSSTELDMTTDLSISSTAGTCEIDLLNASNKLQVLTPVDPFEQPQNAVAIVSPAANELVYSTLTTVGIPSSPIISNSSALESVSCNNDISFTEVSDQLSSPSVSSGNLEPLKELESSKENSSLPLLQELKIQTRKKKVIDPRRKAANRKLNQHIKKMKKDKCNELPDFDHKEMTLTDMVYANPPKKHAKVLGINKLREEERKRRESRESSKAEDHKSSQDENTKAATENSYAGPQLKFDANGDLVMEEAKYHNPSDEEELTYADDLKPINQNSFRKRKDIRSTRWSKEGTEEFYDGLLNVGANFDLMSSIMKKYKDDQLRKKYKIERKKNPSRVDSVLNNHNKNLGDYSTFIQKWSDSNLTPTVCKIPIIPIDSPKVDSLKGSSPELISSPRKLSR